VLLDSPLDTSSDANGGDCNKSLPRILGKERGETPLGYDHVTKR
jgi:hypothetical protein